MQDTFNSTEKKVVAIIICNPADPVSGKEALKYSHVDNYANGGVKKFLVFAAKFPTAQYVNFYSKTTFQYLGRIYLNQTKTNDNRQKNL